MTPLRLSGHTKVFGIFGCPIRHSLSPQMHLAAFDSLNLPNVYLPFEVHPEQLKKAVEAIIPLGIHGINVTIPHKENVIPFLDRISPDAEKIGAINTIEVRSAQLIGHNTDGLGFLASLSEKNIDPSGSLVIMIGSGGAARGVAVALLSAGVSRMLIMARRPDKGRMLADRLTDLFPKSVISVIDFNLEKALPIPQNRTILLINTTPLGMKKTDPLPISPSFIKPKWIVADLIYHPYETPLLIAANKIGAKTVPGLGMLLHQGVLSFEIWTRLKPPIEVMRSTLLEEISKADLRQ